MPTATDAAQGRFLNLPFPPRLPRRVPSCFLDPTWLTADRQMTAPDHSQAHPACRLLSPHLPKGHWRPAGLRVGRGLWSGSAVLSAPRASVPVHWPRIILGP